MFLLARQIGDEGVARWCAEILRGAVRFDDSRRPSISWLGGRHAAAQLGRGNLGAPAHEYWTRVWAARGLLYAWHPDAVEAVLAGLQDPAWRVREMCAKVARTHAVVEAEQRLTRLLDDPVSRVRIAAEAALTVTERSQG